MLSVAAFTEGHYARAFPGFGPERAGVPLTTFCLIDDEPVRVAEPILEPDALIIQDATLRYQLDVFEGLKPDGYILINSNHSLEGLGLGELTRRFDPHRVATVPATDIAWRDLGRPLPNAALLGGFAALSGVVSLASVETAVRVQFSGHVADGNVAAAGDACAFVQYSRRLRREQLAHA
jgi:pyruvate ferredoxin oxidoreductase gamma subunit